MKLWIWLRSIFSIVRTVAAVVATVSTAGAARRKEGATPPHWIWHPARERPRRDFPPRPATSASRSRSRSRRGWCSKPRPTTRSRSISTERSRGRLRLASHAELRNEAGDRPARAGGRGHQRSARAGRLAGARGHPAAGPGRADPQRTRAGGQPRPSPPGTPGPSPVSTTRSGSRRIDLGQLGHRALGGHHQRPATPPRRFHVPEGFRIEMAAAPDVTGSVVAFTFDPDGVSVRLDRARADRPADRRRPRRPVRSPPGHREPGAGTARASRSFAAGCSRSAMDRRARASTG